MKISRLIILLLVSFSMHAAFIQPTVTVLTFTAMEYKSNVKVKWTTSFESEVKDYYVYRSIDRENWFVVGVFPAKTGSMIKDYEFVDYTANGGVNYYKLEAESPNGERQALKYTEIEMEDKTKAVTVYWEREMARIRLKSGEQLYSITLELTDEIGREYPVGFVRDNTHEITIIPAPLDYGAYFLKCTINSNRTVRRKAIY
jgi:hypothetical protein